ncbi:MAG: hypothetical protein HY716_00860 [Planctomycetes bacterium]|nr:hypothetical protein [Planctomycetota bacterium]
MSCPSSDQLEKLFESGLEEADAKAVRGHAEACTSCAAYLKRLEAEADNLKAHMPESPAPPEVVERLQALAPKRGLWPRAALAAVAAAVVLAGVWLAALSRDGESARVRLNVTQRIRSLLKEGRTDLAAEAIRSYPDDPAGVGAADLARLEIAQALMERGDIAAAAEALDPVDLTGKDPAMRARFLDVRLPAAMRLFQERVLQEGRIPTPFDAAHDGVEPDELSRITYRFLSAMAERRRGGAKPDETLDRLEALADATRYALGEISYDELLSPNEDEARFQIGDALYRERQFERAIDMWKPIIGSDPRAARKAAEADALLNARPGEAEFYFEPLPERPFSTHAAPELALHTAYHGPIRLRLYAVDRELRREALVREWEAQFAPLSENGKPASRVTVEIPHREPGRYAVVAEARYCPAAAVATFVVTDVVLVQHVALDRVVLFAADRVSGTPVPDLALQGVIEGRYEWTPEDAGTGEFRRGFEAGWANRPPEPDPTRAYADGHRRASELWRDHPDVRIEFRGSTAVAGIFSWPVAPEWKPGYAYTIRAESAGERTVSRVETAYSLAPNAGALKALVLTDRPVYRPGDLVRFKSLLRQLDSEGLRPYERPEALVEFVAGDRILFARRFAVTEFGTLSGAFTLPGEVEGMDVTALVNGAPAVPSFSVEAFRKPEFEIALRHPETVPAGGEAELEASVRTWSGDPLAGVDVSFQIWAEQIREPDPAAWVEDIQAAEPTLSEARTLKTDAGGRARFRFVTDRGAAPSYQVRVAAADLSRRLVARTARIKVVSPAVRLEVTPDRPAYAPGETAKLRFRLPGAKALRVEEMENSDGRFAAIVSLDSEGFGTCAYPIPNPSRRLRVGVRAGEEWEWKDVPLRVLPRTEEAELQVLADRALYRAGEEAILTIRAPRPDQHVLLLLATGAIRRIQLVRVAQGETAVKIPIVDSYGPDVGVTACAVRNNRLLSASTRLVVPPVDRWISLEVLTNKPDYAPGEECAVTVRAVDASGRVVPDCEISLGVVDEALYGVEPDAAPDAREFFHRYRRPARLSRGFSFSEPTSNLAFHDAEAQGGAPERERRALRAEFVETAFWSPHLKTDAEGRAVATFKLPDHLTTFRFAARGITKDHRVGEARSLVRVRQDFHVRLVLPRAALEGDTAVVTGLVRNGTAQRRSVRCALACPFPIKPVSSPELEVESGEVGRVEYLVAFDHPVEEAKFTFEAEADGLKDAVTLAVPCRRYGIPFLEGRSGTVSSGVPREETFVLPADPVPGSLELRLRFDAGIHSAVIEGLASLIEYPHGCVEQTMSRFLPAVAASRALGADVPHPWKDKLPAVLAEGLRRLYLFQHPDGGWGWWERDASNPAMTAYVLHGLAVCRPCGIDVDQALADRAAAYARNKLEAFLFKGDIEGLRSVPVSSRVSGPAYLALALAEHDAAWKVGSRETRRLVAMLASRDEPRDPADGAVLALACHKLGLEPQAVRLTASVESAMPVDVAAASFLLQLRAVRGGDVGDAVRFLLASRRGRGWRTTMEGATAILGLCAVLNRPSPVEFGPGRMYVFVDGEKAKELVLPGRPDPAFDGRVTLSPPPAKPWGARVVLRLVYEGDGSAYYTAVLMGLWKVGSARPVRRGLEVEREYFARTPSGWKRVEGAVRAGAPVLVRLTVRSPEERRYVRLSDPRPMGFEPVPDAAVRNPGQGTWSARLSDRVYPGEEWPERLEQYRRAVGDAGAETEWALALLEEILARRRFLPEISAETFELPEGVMETAVEHRDYETHFFIERLPAGTSHIYYLARASVAGDARALPPEAEPMYQPEARAAGVEARLRVLDGRSMEGSETADLAPGVEGLASVIQAIRKHGVVVDAGRIIELVEARASFGTLVMSALRSAPVTVLHGWLRCDQAVRAAGSSLAGRVEAARRDVETRWLAARALENMDLARHSTWKALLREAVGDTSLADLVFEGFQAGAVESADGILHWAAADRRFRTEVLRWYQKMADTSRIEVAEIRAITMPEVVRRLGERAPSGDALARWQLAQRMSVAGATLPELIERLEIELGMKVEVRAPVAEAKVSAADEPVGTVLDRWLKSLDLYYRVVDGGLRIGRLEDMVK